MWDWDLASGEIFVEPLLKARLGYGVDEVGDRIGQWSELIHPHDRDRVRDALEAHLCGLTPAFEIEHRMLHRDGSARWFFARGICRRDSEGRPQRVLGTNTPITEHKLDGLTITESQAQHRLLVERLHESEARFRALTELSSDWYWEQDEQLRFVVISDGFQRMSGLSPAQCLGRTRWEIPDKLSDAAERSALDTICAARKAFRDFVLLSRAHDATTRTISISGMPVFDSHGGFRGYRGVAKDITEQQTLRRALADREDRMRLALEYSNIGVWARDLTCDRVSWSANVGPIFGLDPGTQPASFAEVVERFHPADRLRLEVGCLGVPDDALARGVEHRIIHTDGSERWVRQRGRTERGPEGRPIRRLGIIEDVTERKRTELALRDSEERFRNLMELLSDYYWEQDAQFRFTALRQGGRADSRPAGAERIGKTRWECPDLIPEQGWEAHRAIVEHHLPFRDLIVRRRFDNGKERIRSVSGVPVFDADGVFRGYRGLVHDVTERESAHQRLQESESRFRALTELSSDWYWEQDEGLRFVELSAPFSRQFGLSAAVCLGRARWEVPGIAVGETGRAALDAAYAARLPFRDVTIRRRYEDGSVGVFSISGAPIIDVAGRFCGYRGVGRDLTEYEALRFAAAESERRLRLALDFGNIGVWERDVSSARFRLCVVAARILGIGSDQREVTAQDLGPRIHPDDRARLDATEDGFPEALLERGIQHRLVWPDGSVRWVFNRGRVLRAEDGTAIRQLGVIQDITEQKQAELALKVSEERFRTLMQLFSDYYWEQDAQVRFTVLTQGGFGHAPGPLAAALGKARWEIDQLLPPPGGWQAHRDTLERHAPFRDFVVQRRLPSGEERTLSVSGVPVFDGQGVFEGYRGISQDITERERAHRRIQDSEARFRALTELSSDWYWEQDEQMRFTMISENAYRLMKWPPGKFVGQTRWDASHAGVPPETWERHKRRIAARESFYDLIVQRLDGDGALRTHSVSGTPVFDESGRFRGYRGIGRDITETKAAEDALRESEQRFRLLAESTRDVVWISDPALSRIDYVSPAVRDVLGIDAQQLMRDPALWLTLVHPDDAALARSALERQIGGAAVDVEFRIVRPDQQVRWIWLRTYPTRTIRSAAFVCGIAEDITARKLDELRRLEEAVRQRDALVREVHHRIKNSLQGVAGLLRSHAHREQPTSVVLENAIAQVQAIATVHGLRGMDKASGLDIARVVEAIARMVENLTQSRIRLEGLDTDGGGFSLADSEAVAIALILNEIIVNAVKHRASQAEQSEISVALRSTPTTVLIEVRNPGSLAPGLDLRRRTGLGTGLELVCALLPKEGVCLELTQWAGVVSSTLTLDAMVVRPMAPSRRGGLA